MRYYIVAHRAQEMHFLWRIETFTEKNKRSGKWSQRHREKWENCIWNTEVSWTLSVFRMLNKSMTSSYAKCGDAIKGQWRDAIVVTNGCAKITLH
jgi:hypothetical protein